MLNDMYNIHMFIFSVVGLGTAAFCCICLVYLICLSTRLRTKPAMRHLPVVLGILSVFIISIPAYISITCKQATKHATSEFEFVTNEVVPVHSFTKNDDGYTYTAIMHVNNDGGLRPRTYHTHDIVIHEDVDEPGEEVRIETGKYIRTLDVSLFGKTIQLYEIDKSETRAHVVPGTLTN